MPYRTASTMWMTFALAAATLLASSKAGAFVYTVGQSGTGQNCSFPTVQQAIDAAEATAVDDEIWITRDVAGGYYQNQALRIDGLRGRLKIVGGFDDCHDVTPSGVTELHGNGGQRAPVLEVVGGIVTLSNLRFTRGDADDSAFSRGGGVSFQGGGLLDIQDSVIDRNRAGRGAGLSVVPSGGEVVVTLRRTQIMDNQAVAFGGGIYYSPVNEGQGTLHFLDDVRIIGNRASQGGGGVAIKNASLEAVQGGGLLMEANGTLGDGGAILAVSPVKMRLASRPLAGAGATFVANVAGGNGGAIALSSHPDFGTATGDARVQLFSYLDAPQVLAGNRSDNYGGVLFIDRSSTTGNGTTQVCSWNVAYDNNDGRMGGSAIAATGERATFKNTPECGLEETFCSTPACNRFAGNTSTLADGSPTLLGSVFYATDSADIQLFGTRIVQNTVPWVFRMANRASVVMPASIGLDNAFVYANSGTSLLAKCGASCLFDATSSTFAANVLTGAVFAHAAAGFHLGESIVDQPGNNLFEFEPGSTSTLAHLVYTANYASNTPTVRYGAPGFVNAAAGDYRLLPNSEAVDNLPVRNGLDFIGRPRSVDLPTRPNGLGPRDLGAIETQLAELADVIFKNGFE